MVKKSEKSEGWGQNLLAGILELFDEDFWKSLELKPLGAFFLTYALGVIFQANNASAVFHAVILALLFTGYVIAQINKQK